MKEKAFLILFGSLVGIVCGALIALTALALLPHRPQGSEFKSLSDLRQAITERGPEDNKADQSVSLRSIVIPHPSDKIIYTLAPKLNVKFQGVPLQTNSFGMRGPEIEEKKPANTFRLALLGDSFAFGWGVEESKSFARLIEGRLGHLLADGRAIEVLNFAVPGYSTFQEVAQFLESGLRFEPDAVLVYFVTNDFGLPFFVRDLENTEGDLANAVDYVRRLWRPQSSALKIQKKELWDSLNPNHALAELFSILKPRNIELFVAINPGKGWRNDVSRLSYPKKNKEIHLLKIRADVRRMVKKKGLEKQNLVLPQDPHPSAAKHQILANILAKRVAKVLKRKAAANTASLPLQTP